MRRTLVLILFKMALAICRACLVVIGVWAFMQATGLRLCVMR